MQTQFNFNKKTVFALALTIIGAQSTKFGAALENSQRSNLCLQRCKQTGDCITCCDGTALVQGQCVMFGISGAKFRGQSKIHQNLFNGINSLSKKNKQKFSPSQGSSNLKKKVLKTKNLLSNKRAFEGQSCSQDCQFQSQDQSSCSTPVSLPQQCSWQDLQSEEDCSDPAEDGSGQEVEPIEDCSDPAEDGSGQEVEPIEDCSDPAEDGSGQEVEPIEDCSNQPQGTSLQKEYLAKNFRPRVKRQTGKSIQVLDFKKSSRRVKNQFKPNQINTQRDFVRRDIGLVKQNIPKRETQIKRITKKISTVSEVQRVKGPTKFTHINNAKQQEHVRGAIVRNQEENRRADQSKKPKLVRVITARNEDEINRFIQGKKTKPVQERGTIKKVNNMASRRKP